MSMDKALECVFQSVLQIEELRDQTLDTLGIVGEEFTGSPPTPDLSKLDGRINRTEHLSARLQHIHADMAIIHEELNKI